MYINYNYFIIIYPLLLYTITVRLLHNEHSCVDAFDQSVVLLCGHMTVTCGALMDDLDVHFFRFRRQLNNVLRHVTNPSTTGMYCMLVM